jgi:hypothetical protein
MDKLDKDKRFSHIKNDPKFYNMPRKEQKFKIDKRFKVSFTIEREREIIDLIY